MTTFIFRCLLFSLTLSTAPVPTLRCSVKVPQASAVWQFFLGASLHGAACDLIFLLQSKSMLQGNGETRLKWDLHNFQILCVRELDEVVQHMTSWRDMLQLSRPVLPRQKWWYGFQWCDVVETLVPALAGRGTWLSDTWVQGRHSYLLEMIWPLCAMLHDDEVFKKDNVRKLCGFCNAACFLFAGSTVVFWR